MTGGPLLDTVTPPLDGRAFRWSVGTRPVPVAKWLQIDHSRHDLVTAKDAVLDAHLPDAVISTQPSEAASAELLRTVVDHLREWHTGQYMVTSDAIVDVESQRATTIDPDRPLQTLARALPEDFCILTSDDDSWRLTAASVCFTSRWNLRDKMGATVGEIHAPVPGYEERVATAVDHLINRLSVGQVLTRSNWTLLDTAELHLPEPATPRPETTDVWDLKWLRIERQSLRRLPETDAVVFTIGTRVFRVDELEPNDRRRLHEAVRMAPADVRGYKGWPTVDELR